MIKKINNIFKNINDNKISLNEGRIQTIDIFSNVKYKMLLILILGFCIGCIVSFIICF